VRHAVDSVVAQAAGLVDVARALGLQPLSGVHRP
jgi:hypothetical protein